MAKRTGLETNVLLEICSSNCVPLLVWNECAHSSHECIGDGIVIKKEIMSSSFQDNKWSWIQPRPVLEKCRIGTFAAYFRKTIKYSFMIIKGIYNLKKSLNDLCQYLPLIIM